MFLVFFIKKMNSIFFIIILLVHFKGLSFILINLNKTILNEWGFTFNSSIIDLKYKNISHIDSNTFKNLVKCTKLKINGNFITQIENDTFKRLKSIKELDLHRNLLSSLNSSTFDGLENLTFLDLYLNKINFIDKNTFKNVSQLQYLYLDFSNL